MTGEPLAITAMYVSLVSIHSIVAVEIFKILLP